MSSETMPAWLRQRLQKGFFFLTAGFFFPAPCSVLA